MFLFLSFTTKASEGNYKAFPCISLHNTGQENGESIEGIEFHCGMHPGGRILQHCMHQFWIVLLWGDRAGGTVCWLNRKASWRMLSRSSLGWILDGRLNNWQSYHERAEPGGVTVVISLWDSEEFAKRCSRDARNMVSQLLRMINSLADLKLLLLEAWKAYGDHIVKDSI